jgi:hypothetical protein
MTDDDVIAYLAGDLDTAPGLEPSARLERSRSLLADPALWAEPGPDLEQRVVAAVAETRRVTPTEVTAPTEPPAEMTRRRTSHRLRNAVLGAAAAVLVAVGLAAVVTTQRDHPLEFAATLSGTELAPAASGSATMTKTTSGWRIHLSASGLPRLDNGRYYQAWLKNPAGTLVPIGTFNEGRDVTLWSGAAPSDFPTITVTRQVAAAGPASSGQKVLVGTSHRTH